MWSYASLIVFKSRRLKSYKRDELPRNGLRCLRPQNIVIECVALRRHESKLF